MMEIDVKEIPHERDEDGVPVLTDGVQTIDAEFLQRQEKN